jgi:hypothetical protein
MIRRLALCAVVLCSLAACDSKDEMSPETVVDQQQPPPPPNNAPPTRISRPVMTGAFSSDPLNPNGAPGGWAGTSPTRF